MSQGKPATLSGAQWARLEALFDQARDLSPAARADLLQRELNGEPVLRAELEAVLGAEDNAGDFLQSPVLVVSLEPDAPAALEAGIQLGPWRLAELIGRGGMGEVYAARRADGAYELDAAIKILKRGLDTDALVRRFLRERRILAQLAHPHIARLLDAGTTADGRPYLVMERVHGEPITDYCSQRALPLRDILALVGTICAAVQAAHRALIVHRDLKPSNVLVTAQDQVKLLDFGIAKLLDDDDPETTLTATGALTLALTPSYAAPEQILGGVVTTATDVYALGVILYLLLVGRLPHAREGRSAVVLALGVKEESVLRPSSALLRGEGRLAPAERQRRARELRGDLDLIVLKALHPEPDRRYPSAAELGEELRRYLAHEPVSARPDALAYRARKFLRRNWIAVSAAIAVLLAVVGGVGGVLWQAQLARASALRAQAEATRATATKDFLVSVFRASDPRIASDTPRGAITAKELLDRGAERIEKEFADQPELQIELLGLTADIYESGLANEERYAALQKRRIELARSHYGPAHPIVLEGLLQEVRATLYRLDYAKAAQLLSEIDDLLRTSDQDRSLLRAKWWWSKSELIHSSGGTGDDRIRALNESLALYQQLAPYSSDYGYVLSLTALNDGQLDLVQARRLNEQALAVIEAAPDRDDAALPVLLTDHAGLFEALGDFAGAEGAYARAEAIALKTVGERHGTWWEARANRARLLHQRGERKRAHPLFDEMLPKIPTEWSTGTHDAWVRGVYGDCLLAEGRAAEAIPLFEAGLRKFEERPFAPDGPAWKGRLADAYDHVGRTAEARGLLKAAVEEVLASAGPPERFTLFARERWGRFLLGHARPGDADFAAAEAEFLTVLEKAADRPWLESALAHAGLVRIAAARGDAGKALEQSRLALAALERVQELYDVRVQPQLWLVHSAALRASGDMAGALHWAERALEASTRYDHPASPAIAEARAAVRRAGG